MVKNLSAKQEMRVHFLDWHNPLEEEMATHSSVLTWEITWIEAPGRLQSTGSQGIIQLLKVGFSLSLESTKKPLKKISMTNSLNMGK